MGALSMLKRILLAAALTLAACAQSPDARVTAAETLFADYRDAAGAKDTIEFGFVTEVERADRATWEARYRERRAALETALEGVEAAKLSPVNRRALASMRADLEYRASGSLAPTGDCAQRTDAEGDALRAALYACFSEIGDAIAFEGRTYPRTAALQTLERLNEPARRRALFFAIAPLWQAVNGANDPQSPYRRHIRAQAESARGTVARAEASLGLSPGEGEAWLARALEAWPKRAQPVEPWDFRHSYAAGARAVEQCAQVEKLVSVNDRFFADLGADLNALGVMQDVGNRPGMSPVDYSDFVRLGRDVSGEWRPAIARVSVILQEGGIGGAAELAHELGHAVNFSAIRTRPSLALAEDDTVVVEANADITGWSVYSPAWQTKYLGCASTDAEGLRSRLGGVALDLAWGLFEIRMSRDPSQDPNSVWTEITHRYLGVAPHPELSWWAVRVQLVELPGYMIHYALGAFATADMRARIKADIGDFDSGNPRWYAYVSERLFRHGGERPPADLLRAFLGRPVSPDALIANLRRAAEE